MNLLTDTLPESLTVDGNNYPVATSYRDWLRFSELLEDTTLTDMEKARVGLMWFIQERPKNILAAWKALVDFVCCNDMPRAGKATSEIQESTRAPCFSWLYDAPFILGAFRQIYGIDLLTQEMHWYAFYALFQALPDDTPLKQRITLRQTKLADIKDKEQKQRIRKAKMAIAIPQRELTSEEIGAAFL